MHLALWGHLVKRSSYTDPKGAGSLVQVWGNFPSRKENGPRKSEPACKILISAYPVFADECSDLIGFGGQALTVNTILL